jgi:hypothetical protein
MSIGEECVRAVEQFWRFCSLPAPVRLTITTLRIKFVTGPLEELVPSVCADDKVQSDGGVALQDIG